MEQQATAPATETNPTNTASSPGGGLRQLFGLQPGRVVNYVMRDGGIRPLIVVAIMGDGKINGVLFFDGAYDQSNHPVPLAVEASGHLPTHSNLLTSVKFDDEGVPGTWHWPARQALIASGIDAAVLQNLHSEVIADVNEKFAHFVETVQAQLNSFGDLLKASERLPDLPGANDIQARLEGEGGVPLSVLPQGKVPDVNQLEPASEVKTLPGPVSGS